MRRSERVVASRGRALTYAVLRAHKFSLFFGDFYPQPWGVSGCFFTTAGQKKSVKHRFSAHLTKKRCADEVFTGDMYKTVEKLCKNLFDLPTLIIIWTHHSDTILKIERELCKRIGRGAPVPRLPLRLGCKRSAPARPLSLAPPRRAPPGRPLPTHSPTPFCAPRPTVRPFPTGRGYRSAPLAPSNPLPQRKAANSALPFSPFSAPILYIRAREGDFSSPRREGDRCTRRWKNGKVGRNAREGGHFLHTVEKTVENKLWISGKSARFFYRSATNGGEAVDGARAAGR